MTYIVSIEASAAHPTRGHLRESGSHRVNAVSRKHALDKGIALAERLDTYARYADAPGWHTTAEATIAGVA